MSARRSIARASPTRSPSAASGSGRWPRAHAAGAGRRSDRDVARVRRELRERAAAGDDPAPPAPREPDRIHRRHPAGDAARRSTATRATTWRASACRRCRSATRRARLHASTATSTSSTALAARQRRDPRAAAPRRVGVGRTVDDRPGATQMTVVVEPLDPPELFEWFADLRKDLGMHVVPLGPERRRRGAEGAARQRASCACCAIATSSAPASRSSSSASGRRCRPARRRSRCAPARRCCRSACYFTEPRQRPPRDRPTARADGPLTAAACATTSTRVTQALADELEFLIRRAPEQWHLFQPNWPSDPGYDD